jgi:Uma2 family endonuclease
MVAIVTSLEEQQQAILDLLPVPGNWSERDYLWLTDHTRQLVEFTDGQIEILPMPTGLHQVVVQFMFLKFLTFITPTGGMVHFAPIRMQVRPGKFREPDLLLVKSAKDPRRRNRYWTGADLTLEVVSPEKPERDLVDKRHDYAEGNVPEYWIVNPQTETITVLRLENAVYVEHGVFQRGQQAASVILPEFAVNVSDVFDVDSPPDNPLSTD